jgi:hypothetical protein
LEGREEKKSVFDCSKECQKLHWKEQKWRCTEPVSKVEDAPFSFFTELIKKQQLKALMEGGS